MIENSFFDMTLDLNFENENLNLKDKPERKKTERPCALVRKQKNIYRKAFSELNLIDITKDFVFEENMSCHFITGGDIDSLSFLKLILRQQNLDYCFLSTWCIESDDILQIDEWIAEGKIKKIDVYVGEIFPGSYSKQFVMLKDILRKCDGKIVVFRNHAKIYAGYGDKFYFGIQTSANVNTNPRTENVCITIGKEIFDFYFSYFNGIKSFEKE